MKIITLSSVKKSSKTTCLSSIEQFLELLINALTKSKPVRHTSE